MLQERRFSTPAPAHDDEYLTGVHFERYIVEDGIVTVPYCEPFNCYDLFRRFPDPFSTF